MPASSRLLRAAAANSGASRPSWIDCDRPDAELRQRREHHQPDERERQDRGRQGGHAVQADGRHEVAARRELGVARTAAREALEHEQRERDRHQQRRELHRGLAVECVEPDAVDRVGEGPHAEQVHGAEVGERLHQRERHAAEDRRPRQRQAHAQDRPRSRQPEPARRLEQRARLAEERGPRQQVHVRVQHEREHADRAERRADARQVEAEREEREHVARHRERQHERPLDPAPPGELEERDERRERRCRAGACRRPRRRSRMAVASRASGRKPEKLRQPAGRDDERERQADQRTGHQQRAQDRADGEAIEPRAAAGLSPTPPRPSA